MAKLNMNSEPYLGFDLNLITPSNFVTIILLMTSPKPIPSVLDLFLKLLCYPNNLNNFD